MSFSDEDFDLDMDGDLGDGMSSVEQYPEIDFEALGIVPDSPTLAKPGSEEKVVMLAARYAAGLPLWHNADCVDHGPDGADDDE